jgi:hypothetical protein
MGRFFLLMITMFLKRNERIGINVMFFFSFVWWRMVQMMELDNGVRL